MTPHTLDAISTDKIILKKNTKQLHYFYNLLTFLKNQTYVSVPNINNSADSLVHKLNILGLKQ